MKEQDFWALLETAKSDHTEDQVSQLEYAALGNAFEIDSSVEPGTEWNCAHETLRQYLCGDLPKPWEP